MPFHFDRLGRHTLRLHVAIYIIKASASVQILIMCDVVNLVFLDERFVDDPWSFRDHFVDPSTMSGSF